MLAFRTAIMCCVLALSACASATEASPPTAATDAPPARALPTWPADESQPDLELPPEWTLIDVSLATYICAPAFGRGLADDYDCVRHRDMVPDAIVMPELRCSESFGRYDCTRDRYYPSEMDGYEIVRIGGRQAICEASNLGEADCWLWENWQSPERVRLGSPDYRCVGNECEPAYGR